MYQAHFNGCWHWRHSCSRTEGVQPPARPVHGAAAGMFTVGTTRGCSRWQGCGGAASRHRFAAIGAGRHGGRGAGPGVVGPERQACQRQHHERACCHARKPGVATASAPACYPVAVVRPPVPLRSPAVGCAPFRTSPASPSSKRPAPHTHTHTNAAGPLQAINNFCREIGVTRSEGEVHLHKLDHHIRADLDATRCVPAGAPLLLHLCSKRSWWAGSRHATPGWTPAAGRAGTGRGGLHGTCRARLLRWARWSHF